MILITAATSHFGQATIKFLLEKGVPPTDIIAMVRDEVKAEPIKAQGVSLVKGDYEDYDSLLKGFAGIDKMLFISSGDMSNRTAHHLNVVKAAKEAGVGNIVYTSFLSNNETETSAIWSIGESHKKAEQAMKESGMTYTFLKNTLYLDYVPMFMGEKVLETGTIYLPAGEGKSTFVLREEMAEAAANILTTKGHENKTYKISSEKTWSYREIAQILTNITGKPIKYVSPTPEEFGETMKKAGVPDMYIGVFTVFSVAIAQNELNTPDNTLEKLLGRKPTDLETFFNQVYSN